MLRQLHTGHTLVESTLFPRHFSENTLNQSEIDGELTSVPSRSLVDRQQGTELGRLPTQIGLQQFSNVKERNAFAYGSCAATVLL